MNIKAIKNRKDFDAYIAKTPYPQLVEDFYETILANQQLMNTHPQKIKISLGQFLNLFEIQGYKMAEDGEMVEQLEKRGRKKIILSDEDKQKQIERRREYQRQRYHNMKNK